MEKYSFEFKKTVAYLQGKGGCGVGKDKQVCKWVKAYQTFGDEGRENKANAVYLYHEGTVDNITEKGTIKHPRSYLKKVIFVGF